MIAPAEVLRWLRDKGWDVMLATDADIERIAGLFLTERGQRLYAESKAQFDREYGDWKAGGKIGSPPPRPVPPHTPGWNPAAHPPVADPEQKG